MARFRYRLLTSTHRCGRHRQYRCGVPAPVVAKLWISAAERAIDDQAAWAPGEIDDVLRSSMHAAASAAEELLNVVAGPRGAERTAAIDVLVERFGDRAVDVGYIAAAFIFEAVATTSVDHGIDAVDARRISECCRDAVIEASSALDSISALVDAHALPA